MATATQQKDWEVVVWVSANKGSRSEFDTKEDAYRFANANGSAYCVEVYGPDGYYDAA